MYDNRHVGSHLCKQQAKCRSRSTIGKVVLKWKLGSWAGGFALSLVSRFVYFSVISIHTREIPSCYYTAEDLSWGMNRDMIVHNGGCHCRKIRWRIEAPNSVVAWKCNCSDCSMRANIHFSVPFESFELLGDSKEFLSTYTFGTHTAKHTFCKVCGITSFYIPRGSPDRVAVTFKCVDPGTLSHVEIKHYDGSNWESADNQTGIASCSITKEPK